MNETEPILNGSSNETIYFEVKKDDWYWVMSQLGNIEMCKDVLQKIVDMESPVYFRESELETPYNYAKVTLEKLK